MHFDVLTAARIYDKTSPSFMRFFQGSVFWEEITSNFPATKIKNDTTTPEVLGALSCMA